MLQLQWSQRHMRLVLQKLLRFYSVSCRKSCCRLRILSPLCRKRPRESKNNIRAWYFEDCLFCIQDKLQIATCEQDLVIHAPMQTSKYWLFHCFYRQLPRGTKTDGFDGVFANAWIWRRRAAARTWTFWGRFIVKTRRTCIGMVLLERSLAHLELRFPTFLGRRTLRYRFL